ncbi:MAG: M20 family metallo-hydrolase [Opitutaceae bacterium]|nr:M20 family metallo-hydrolase [Cytophagales bacterium]
MEISTLQKDAIELLKNLISTESFSRQEDKTATLIHSFFTDRHIPAFRHKNNVWANNKYYDENKPTILLNSHHDTVKPNPGYTLNPYEPIIKDGKLYGLGSNDAGGCLVSLIAAFLYFYDKPGLKYNFVLAASAEEEVSGFDGLELIYSKLGLIDFAIVGEPTNMNIAVAEKGLMVLDCTAKGKAGHAAREEGDNAIYKAVKDIQWLQNFRFEKVSDHLGPIKMSVTIINAGSQHNVVPENCTFTIDVRLTDSYSMEEVLETIQKNITSEVKPRSFRLKPSFIDINHPLVIAAKKNGAETYGSPTTSDQALIPAPSVKMGPGESGRSHTADEFIYLEEIEKGIQTYINILNELV